MKESTTQKLVLIMLLLISSITQSQVNQYFKDIKFGDSFLKSQKNISKLSKSIQIVEISSPSFPLSKDNEKHVIASKVKGKYGIIKKVVFTFSDDKLSFIQAKGNVVKALVSEDKNDFVTYINYQIYDSGRLYINQKTDVASFLTAKSLHLNLFSWTNPYLSSNIETNYNSSVKIPSFIKMGNKSENLLAIIKDSINLVVDVKYLGKKNSIEKTQANVFGIEYAGFPRKFEIRFENNQLSKVWILTGKEEEYRIHKKLIQEFGKSIFENDNWIVFNNWTVLLRKDKPEIFLITQELGLVYKEQYTNKSP